MTNALQLAIFALIVTSSVLASRLRTSAQKTMTNIPVGWNQHNLLLPSCIFLLLLSVTDGEERLIPIYLTQD